jgi:Glycosyl hydrolase catalytic core
VIHKLAAVLGLIFVCGAGSATASAATLSVSPALVSPGGWVTVSWNGVSSPTSTDWVDLLPAASSTSTPAGRWFYDDSCSRVNGSSAQSSGSCDITIPAGDLAGSFVFKLFAGGAYTLVATSNTLTVGTNTAPTLSVSNGTITWTGQGSGVSDYKGATSNVPRGRPGRTTTYTDLGSSASSWAPPTPACGVTDYYGVATEGASGEQWSTNEVAISGSASCGNTPPSITVSGGTISWPSQPGVTDFRGAISNLPRGQQGRTTSYVDLGNVASWTPSTPPCDTTSYYGVASEGPSGEQWSTTEAPISGPACSPSPVFAGDNTGFVVGIQGKDEGQNTFAGLGGETVPQDIASLVPSIRWDNDAYTPSDLESEYGTLGVKADLLLGTGTYNTGSSTGDEGANWGTGGIGGWALQQVTNIMNACGSSNPSAECPFVEILNEPYGSWYYGSNADSEQSADAYAQAVQDVYSDIHTAFGNTSPKVLAWAAGPGCPNGNSPSCTDQWFTWLRDDYPNLGNYYDGVVVHPYGGGSGYSQTLSAQGNRNAVTSAYNATGKPVYVTEVGWPTDTGASDTGDSQQWTETQQADNIYDFVQWARSTGYVAGVWLYNYTDDSAPAWYGVTRNNEPGQTAWSRKPGWTALQEAAQNTSCTVC